MVVRPACGLMNQTESVARTMEPLPNVRSKLSTSGPWLQPCDWSIRGNVPVPGFYAFNVNVPAPEQGRVLFLIVLIRERPRALASGPTRCDSPSRPRARSRPGPRPMRLRARPPGSRYTKPSYLFPETRAVAYIFDRALKAPGRAQRIEQHFRSVGFSAQRRVLRIKVAARQTNAEDRAQAGDQNGRRNHDDRDPEISTLRHTLSFAENRARTPKPALHPPDACHTSRAQTRVHCR